MMRISPPKSSRPLHGFTPPSLRWGRHKHMRCVNASSNGVQDSRADQRLQVSTLEGLAESKSRELELEMQTSLRKAVVEEEEKEEKHDDIEMVESVELATGVEVKEDKEKKYDEVQMEESLVLSTAVSGEEKKEEKNDETEMEVSQAVANLSMAVAVEKAKEKTNDGEDMEDSHGVANSSTAVAREEEKEKKNDNVEMEELPVVVLSMAVAEEEQNEKKNDDVEMEPSPAVGIPWNLRARTYKCKSPNVMEIDGKKATGRKSNGGAKVQSLKIRRENQKKKVLNVVVPLAKAEIEEDFMKMVGLKPPRRPKKRTRSVQKELDTLFPGLSLWNITVDWYDIPKSFKRKKQ